MKEYNTILIKSKQFALRIVRLYKYLCENKKGYILSKQIVRSETSIGANAKEASVAQSKADFYAKLSISLKEAAETEYWLEIYMKVSTLMTDNLKVYVGIVLNY